MRLEHTLSSRGHHC